MARDSKKQEFVMLAHDHVPEKHGYCAYYASTKLDGIRAFWDGGITRGLSCSEVPWANTAKDDRYKIPPRATGLWTRYGKTLQAPDWFLDSLPQFPLDGEMDCGNWETLSSIIKKLTPNDSDWEDVTYMVFDSPPLREVLADREIKNQNFKKELRNCFKWAMTRYCLLGIPLPFAADQKFSTIYANLQKYLPQNKCVQLHKQTQISSASSAAAKAQIEELLEPIIAAGEEGLILRSPISFWKPERSYGMLKVKPTKDAEGTVIGYKWGKATDVERSISGESTDRLLGLMGSLRIKYEKIEFDLASGFNLGERKMSLVDGRQSDTVIAHGTTHQGEVIPEWIHNPLFPVGSRITFRYRSLTNEGIPKEARFWRKYDVL